MNIETIILYITSLVGCAWIFYNFVIPIVDAILFSIGYTIFNIIHLSKVKIVKNPPRFIWYVVKVFSRGFINRTCDFGTLESSKTSKWIWKPYFHYERISK